MTKYEKELQSLKPLDEIQFTEKDNQMDLDFITTAGHGYLVVPKNHEKIDIAIEICKFGFIGDEAVYLEEDCEYGEFVKKTVN